MNGDVLDTLGEQDASRIREVSVMLPMEGPLSDEKLQEIRAAAARYIKARGVSQELLTQKLGSNATYVSNFLSGKFGDVPSASLQKLARIVNEWLEADHRRVRSQNEHGYVPTRVAQRVWKVAQHVCETGDIGLVHGPAGCGKTTTLRELAKSMSTSIYVLLTTDCTRRTGFLRALREAVWQHRAPSRPTLGGVNK